MADVSQGRLADIVTHRLDTSKDQIAHSLRQIAHGNPLGAETEPERAEARLRAKLADIPTPVMRAADPASMARSIQESAAAIERPSSAEGFPPPKVGPESIVGPTLDFVGVSFFSRGRRAADAVARIAFRGGRPQGSGFLVAPGVLLTNQHVIESAQVAGSFVAQFDYETDDNGREVEPTEFAIDGGFFVADPYNRLDYALVALGPRVAGRRTPESFSYIPLSAASDKHMLGEVANIVQHPNGRRKEVVLRENRLVSRLDWVLHYIADTEGGSSGSPVFNNDWQVIALHHWGGAGPLSVRDLMTNRNAEFNEGVRISRIVADLEAKRSGGVQGAEQIGRLLEVWSTTKGLPVSPGTPQPFPSPAKPPPNREANGSRPMPRRSIDFSDRTGYEPGFIRGFNVPLPKTSNVRYAVAPNIEARHGEDPHELPYRHFSIVMNAERRLAFFTACNIDGRRSRHVIRKNKTIDDNATLAKRDLESLTAPEAMEATDPFRPDPRIHDEHQMGREFYEKQAVPGHPDPNTGGRRARMFQKGHIIMRTDPAWGGDEETLQGEDDTFFYTNAAPQFGFFNQGSAANEPGKKGTLRWRAVETYVLRNAVTSRDRVSVFAGPVFRERNDREPVEGDRSEHVFKRDLDYRGNRVPMQFWKIVVWPDGEDLRSIALLAEQWSVYEKLTQGIPGRLEDREESYLSRPERYDEVTELRRVEPFLSRVEVIEALTGLVFPDIVKDGDIMKGHDLDKIVLDSERGIGAFLRNPGRRSDGNGNGAAAASNPAARKAAKKKPAKKKPAKKVMAARASGLASRKRTAKKKR